VNTLPVKIEPGQELEVQLCPHGQYEAMLSERGKKPEPVVQDCSPDVLAAIATAFIPEVLVDTDHESERPDGSTEAYAWITEVRHDPDAGLMGTFRFTDLGAGAVSARRFRFVSPSFEIVKGKGSTVVPVALLSCALTNRPNLPVRCVLNRAAPETKPVEEAKVQNMTETAKLLGLPETATDAEIAAGRPRAGDASTQLGEFGMMIDASVGGCAASRSCLILLHISLSLIR
jgi:phage I-like protein